MAEEHIVPTLRLRQKPILEATGDRRFRDAPYVARGRNRELLELIRDVSNMPSVMQIIMGPPRCGKTTLLAYMEEWARQRGIRVISLDSGSFMSSAELARRIDPTGTKSQTYGESESASLGISGTGTASETATSVTEESSTNITAAIERVAHPDGPGVLITIDELSGIEASPDASVKERLHVVLQFMQTSILRPVGSGKQLKGMLVATGLLGTQDALHRLRLSGVEPGQILRMGPLSEKAMDRVVEDHWQYGRPAGLDAMPLPPEEFRREVVDSCSGFARHVHVAAYELAKQAVEVSRDQRTRFEVSDCTAIREKIKADRDELYENRWTSLTDQESEDAQVISGLLARASKIWDNRLPTPLVLKLTQTVAGGTAGDEMRLQLRAENVLRRLAARGIIEERKPAHRYPSLLDRTNARRHWMIAVPSLADFIISRYAPQGLDSGMDNEDVRRLLEPDEHTLREFWIPEWQWANDDEPVFIPMPDSTSEREIIAPSTVETEGAMADASQPPGRRSARSKLFSGLKDDLGSLLGNAWRRIRNKQD